MLLIGCGYLIATISIPTITTPSFRRIAQPITSLPFQTTPTISLPATSAQDGLIFPTQPPLSGTSVGLNIPPTNIPAQVTPIPTIHTNGSALNPQDRQVFDQANGFTVGADSMRFGFAININVQQNAERADWRYSVAGVVTGMSDLTRFGMQVDDSSLPLPLNNQFVEAIGYFVIHEGSVYLSADIPGFNARILPIQFDMETMMCSAIATMMGSDTLDPMRQDGVDCIDQAVETAFETIDYSSVYSAMSLGQFITTVRGAEQNGLTPYISTVDIPGLLTSPDFSTFILGSVAPGLGMEAMADPAMMSTLGAQIPTLEALIPTLQATDPAMALALQDQVNAFRQLEQGTTPQSGIQTSLGISAADLPPMSLTIEHWVETANPRIRQVIINFDLRIDDPQNTANTLAININAILNLEGYNLEYIITPMPDAARVTDFLNLPTDRLTLLNPQGS